MASTTLNSLTLPSRTQPTVGASLQALWAAGQALSVAVWQAVVGAKSAPAKTAYQEAEELRTYAATIQSSDPEFANDLFAAADRHEGL
ncbi:hypothetical protein [Rhodoferax sp. TS-BS-61-7]|uniref:hypothetical protein n=1 Tax=Rhodoferax sp. TS-BS-61-7 TaxID=2094194 RepID=UPI000CF73B00|nr:hypothetical protein [Rhodoferax sp. TS-BS-61-7]PQA76347.1 hypothetical protein C5F53_15585 [Rhodoferax sp. TS-BS-61-7]